MGRQREDGELGLPEGVLHPLLQDRWSTRVFDPEHELTDEQLTTVLQAARWSPSAGNSQPWAFLVCRRGDDSHRRFVPALSRGNSWWVPRASAVLIACHRTGSEPDSDLRWPEYAPYDLGQAVAHLTVQAAALGLDVHQFAGLDRAAVAAEFAVPAHWAVATGVAIGRAAPVSTIEQQEPSLAQRERRPRHRKPLSDFVFASRFGESAVLAEHLVDPDPLDGDAPGGEPRDGEQR